MKSILRKISKYVTLIESSDGRSQAVYFHRKHVLLINYDQWDLNDIDYGNLPVNQFKKADIDTFYDILEKLEK